MTIEAIETNLTATDVPEDELWDLEEFKDYRVKLINNGGQAEILDFEEMAETQRTLATKISPTEFSSKKIQLETENM